MPYALPSQTAANFTAGPDQLFLYIASQVPMFFPMVLFAFFVIIWFSGMSFQKRQEGREFVSQWYLIAGFLTATLAMILYLVPGFVNLLTVGICIANAGLGALWFFNSRDR